MADFFDSALHYLGDQNKKNGDIFVMNIGSMDGITFDEMHAYTTMYNFKGLYVEPIPYLFEKLTNNIKGNNLFENSAISDYDGEIEMITIDRKAIDSGLLHSCFYGMSAVYPPKNGLGSEGDKQTVEKYGILLKVPCITFDTLISKHNISKVDVIKIDAEGHDYKIFKQIDFLKLKPRVIRLEWINLSDEEKKNIIYAFTKYDYTYEITSQDVTGITKLLQNEMDSNQNDQKTQKTITYVIGLWDISKYDSRDNVSYDFQNYLNSFSKLLKINVNMIIFGDEHLQNFVNQNNRSHNNTKFIVRNINWFKNNDYYNKIQNIRLNSLWYEKYILLKDSIQANNEMFNPISMSKMFLLNDARIIDVFNSDYYFWIDIEPTFTDNFEYLVNDKILEQLQHHVGENVSKFTFMTMELPSIQDKLFSEVYGFGYDKICKYSKTIVNKIVHGSFFGGPKQTIAQINAIYYSLLMETLADDLMGTNESIFTIILHKYSNITNPFPYLS